jgi:hypothetical protein
MYVLPNVMFLITLPLKVNFVCFSTCHMMCFTVMKEVAQIFTNVIFMKSIISNSADLIRHKCPYDWVDIAALWAPM